MASKSLKTGLLCPYFVLARHKVGLSLETLDTSVQFVKPSALPRVTQIQRRHMRFNGRKGHLNIAHVTFDRGNVGLHRLENG